MLRKMDSSSCGYVSLLCTYKVKIEIWFFWNVSHASRVLLIVSMKVWMVSRTVLRV